MKVLYDVTPLMPKHIQGVGVYTLNLYRGLRGQGVDTSPVYKSPKSVKENFIESHIKNNPKVFYGLLSPKGAVLHATDVNLLSDSPKFKKVITVHDMAMYHNDLMDPRIAKRLQDHLQSQLHCNPDAVIVPSYDVHAEFLVHFPKFMNKVHVVYHGADHLIDSTSFDVKGLTDKPYFLFVGVLEKRKNLLNILAAFDKYCELEKDTQFVIAGDDGYGAEAIHQFINTMNHRRRVIRAGYIPNHQLKKVYSNARALVMPSFYEGFGLPIVEAMKMGCPVVTSSIGAMAEIGREHAHLVNPTKPDQIMGAMERIVFDRNYRDTMVNLGLERVEKMTWLNCARETAQVYAKISQS